MAAVNEIQETREAARKGTLNWGVFQSGSSFTAKDLAHHLGYSTKYCDYIIQCLVKDGLVVETMNRCRFTGKPARYSSAKSGCMVATPKTCDQALEAALTAKKPSSKLLVQTSKDEWETNRGERVEAIRYVKRTGKVFIRLATKHVE